MELEPQGVRVGTVTVCGFIEPGTPSARSASPKSYYGWSKEFLDAGKRRLAGDTARAATSGEVKDLRREAAALKEVVADLTLESRLLKKP